MVTRTYGTVPELSWLLAHTVQCQSCHGYSHIWNSRENGSERPPSTLDLLLEFLAKQENLGDIMMLGDLNARIGLCSPSFEDEDTEIYQDFASRPASHPELSKRSSRDNTVNSRGRLLLDFLACTRLTVLNGTTLW